VSRPAAETQSTLFSPAADLLLVANVGWPLLLFIDLVGDLPTHESLLFWQVFFITTPHRWVTLAVVLRDRQRRVRQSAAVGAIAAGAFLVPAAVFLGSGSLLCLGVIDHAWNAWHFASQHHGVLRLYQRRAGARIGSGMISVEKWTFRLMLLYVIARVAGLGWKVGPFPGTEVLQRFDPVVLVPAAVLLAREWLRWWRRAVTSQTSRYPAAAIYLTSVISLFLALLAAAHAEQRKLILALSLASAVFHATEYFAVVHWSSTLGSSRQAAAQRPAAVSASFTNGCLQLAAFALIIGLGNYVVSRGFFEVWVAVNLAVAFCHYGFDGIIWRSRPSAPVAVAGQQA